MTLDEAQSAWNAQPVRPIDLSVAFEQVTKTRRSTIAGLILLGTVLLTASFTLWHQVSRAIADNAYTFANSSLDLAITSIGIILLFRGFLSVLRVRRGLRTLSKDTRECVEFLVQNAHDEVRSVRWHLPLMLGGILLLGLASRVQLVLGGVAFTGGWAEWILVGICVLIIHAYFRYRLRVHLQPRLETLEAIQAELADNA